MNTPIDNQHIITTNQLDLSHLWSVLYAQKWRIILLTVVVAMLSILVVLSMQPIYRATATLLIEPKQNNIVSAEELFGLDTSRSEYLSTQFTLLESRELLKSVVKKLALENHPEFAPQEHSETDKRFSLSSVLSKYLPITKPDDLSQSLISTEEDKLDTIQAQLAQRVSISPIINTQLVKINVDMADPYIAAQIADSIANNYISDQLDARLGMRETATSWMSERLIDLKNKLQTSERRLQSYREQENLIDLEGVTTLSADSISSLSSRLTDSRKELANAKSQYQQVDRINKNDLERLSSVPAILSNSGVQQFKSEQARALSRVEELSRRYGPKHPKMISAQSELNSANQSLRRQVNQVVASIEKNYLLAKANEETLAASYEENRADIQLIAKKEFTLRELQLEVDTNRSLYNTFLGRLKETSATTDMETANARIVDTAVVPKIPIKPRKKLIVMLSTLLALMSGAGIALLSDALGNTFTSAKQLEEALNLPVLGSIPYIKRQKRKELALSFVKTPKGAFAESIRSLRTNTLLSSTNDRQQLIFITSSVPEEGKSVIASNLALSLGQLKNTLLIDADLRQPVIGKSYDLALGTPGLANLLSDTAELDECLSERNGIHVMGAGATPPNPLDLLSSSRFEELVTQLRGRFDYIVIDTPPVQAVSDALVLAKNADVLLQVVRSDSTSKTIIESSVGQMLQSKLRVSGVVLSQVDTRKMSYYGYEKYHS